MTIACLCRYVAGPGETWSVGGAEGVRRGGEAATTGCVIGTKEGKGGDGDDDEDEDEDDGEEEEEEKVEEEEAEEDEEEEGKKELDEGWIAERSTSRGEEDGCGGTTRMRPSNPIAWSLCLSQHFWQMRLLMETSTCGLSCRVNTSGEGSG
jgi:hypothetical protein